MKKEVIKEVLRIVIAVLTALLTALGATGCAGLQIKGKTEYEYKKNNQITITTEEENVSN